MRNVDRRFRFEALGGDLAWRLGVVKPLLGGLLRGRLEGVTRALRAANFVEACFEGVLLFPELSDSKSKRPRTRPSLWAVGARDAW